MLRAQHPSAASETSGVYSRKEVCRLLHIEGRQLRSWERQQLIGELKEYHFSDLLVLKMIMRLRAQNAHPTRVRQALHALRGRLVSDSGEDVRVYKDGRRVRIQIGKQKMEPLSGQLVFDFPEAEINRLLQLPVASGSGAKTALAIKNKIEADRWFERGLELEQTGAPAEQVIEAYTRAAELDPHAAGAMVNLGTVLFNGHAWADAEMQYKRALAIDPNYPLAHFNLGNLYDEQGDPAAALLHYRAALSLVPRYADAHYNLALLYQGMGEVMNAVRHWREYLKLDSKTSWGQIARRELDKLESVTVVQGNRPGSGRSRWAHTE